jgi:hypothetical protein
MSEFLKHLKETKKKRVTKANIENSAHGSLKKKGGKENQNSIQNWMKCEECAKWRKLPKSNYIFIYFKKNRFLST